MRAPVGDEKTRNEGRYCGRPKKREVRFESRPTCVSSASARIDRRRRDVLEQCLAKRDEKRGGDAGGGTSLERERPLRA